MVVYAVAWGSPDLDDVVNMDAECNDDSQRIVVVAVQEHDGSDDRRFPSIDVKRFACLCISRCVLCARQRESPYVNGSTLRIMGNRPIWWVEKTPCAVRRISANFALQSNIPLEL